MSLECFLYVSYVSVKSLQSHDKLVKCLLKELVNDIKYRYNAIVMSLQFVQMLLQCQYNYNVVPQKMVERSLKVEDSTFHKHPYQVV